MENATASRPTVRSAMSWAFGRDHLAEWRDEIERCGLGILAQATSFPGDPHWPGDAPSREWWRAVTSMPDASEPWINRWIESARTGASIALDILDLEGATDQPHRAMKVVEAAVAWRAWRNDSGPSTLGRGPRIRPVFSQDDSARFVARPGVAVDTPSLVDRVAGRVLGDAR